MIAGKTGRHTYTEWDQVLVGAGAAHPAMNPFNMPANAECRRTYSKDMCARSLGILNRTVMVAMHPLHTAQDIDDMIHNIGAAGQTPLTSNELKSRFDAARSVAAEAGRLALRFLAEPQRLQIASKGPQDIVTAADLAVERLIVQSLKRMFPGDCFLAEETYAETSSETLRALWVIDPIDGTGNFACGRSEWCVSIGFMHLGEPVIGVIDIPTMNEQFAALRGGGAACNGKPVRVSDCGSLARSTLGVDYSYRHSSATYLEILQALFEKKAGFRCNGSSAVSLAHVVCGRFDGFVELHLYPWDVMAGIVLIQEAGGWVNDFLGQGGLRNGGPMIAATAGIRDELTTLLGKIVAKA